MGMRTAPSLFLTAPRMVLPQDPSNDLGGAVGACEARIHQVSEPLPSCCDQQAALKVLLPQR